MKPVLANIIVFIGAFATFQLADSYWLLIPIALFLVAGALHGWDANDQINRGR